MSEAKEIAFHLRKLADEVESMGGENNPSGLSLGQVIVRERSRQRMSQSELAKLSGVSANTIIRIENGHTKPRTATLMSLAEALGVSLSLLEAADG